MNGSLQYSALSRLLTLNNRVHDLQRQILAEPVTGPANRIAEMQEEIDQWSRARLGRLLAVRRSRRRRRGR